MPPATQATKHEQLIVVESDEEGARLGKIDKVSPLVCCCFGIPASCCFRGSPLREPEEQPDLLSLPTLQLGDWAHDQLSLEQARAKADLGLPLPSNPLLLAGAPEDPEPSALPACKSAETMRAPEALDSKRPPAEQDESMGSKDCDEMYPLLPHAKQCALRSVLRKGDPEAKKQAKSKRKPQPKKPKEPKCKPQPKESKVNEGEADAPLAQGDQEATKSGRKRKAKAKAKCAAKRQQPENTLDLEGGGTLLAICDGDPFAEEEPVPPAANKASKKRGRPRSAAATDKAASKPAKPKAEGKTYLATDEEKKVLKQQLSCISDTC